MSPLLLLAITIVVMIVGMIWNNMGLAFDQPASSSEQDLNKRTEADRQAYRKFFDQQRSRFLKRQKRVGQFAWLVLIGFLVSFGWMYIDTVTKTTASKQIATIQTVSTAEGKEVVLFVTLTDGNKVKYLIKSAKADKADGDGTHGFSKEPISSWELSGIGTALSVGNSSLPLGIALKISNN
jgi:prolyl-tRNA synthetase